MNHFFGMTYLLLTGISGHTCETCTQFSRVQNPLSFRWLVIGMFGMFMDKSTNRLGNASKATGSTIVILPSSWMV
jgi:hypothetical protein